MKKSLTSIAAVALMLSATSCKTSDTGVRCPPIAALPEAAWESSQWLSAPDAQVATGPVNSDTTSPEGASWFTCAITNEKRIVVARWMTAGLGVYELYVNGTAVGREVLKPGFTHPLKTKRSFTYDVTSLMRCKSGAVNRLAVQVTPGWWGDKIVTPSGGNGMWGTRCAFRGVLELFFADGTSERYGTNATDWQAGIAGPVRHAGIFEGERYDAREPMPSEQDVTLHRPDINTEFKGDILPDDGAEVYHRHDLALPVVEAYTWKDIQGATDGAFGHVVPVRRFAKDETITLLPGETLVVDFGQNAAAVPAFTFKARGGTELTCLPGEILNDGNGDKSRGMDGPEGSVHRTNLRAGARHMQMHYTFGDAEGYVSYHPRYTFYGYRYASITATDVVTFKRIESVPVTSISKDMETGVITTGNELINRLIANTVWGQRSNYLSIPTDCPQRDERQGWTADTQVFAETGTFFARTDRFFHKWMRDVRDTQSPEGGFPSVAPYGQYGDAGMMRLGWSDAGVIVPWTVWKQFGDTAIINENWEAMERFVQHISQTRYDHEALRGENGNYQWADWLSYEPLESCGGGAFEGGQPKADAVDYWSYLSASYWVIDADMMADMARATGHDDGGYRQMAASARAYLRERFLNADGTFKTGILNTMQTPALFALKNGIVSGEAKERLIARLRQNFADHDGCLQTGFLGTSILMGTLTDNGMTDVAYELLFNRKNPSWLYSVDNGATTIWERWNSYTKEHGMGPRGMNSFNHYAYGCVCQWLWETAAGIAADPSQPGFRHIIMRPVPDRRLGHLEAQYRSAAGLIKSAWHYDGDTWTWTFTIPRGATASVTIPGEQTSKLYTAGTYKLRKRL